MPLIELSRFYPATPDETYTAVVNAVQQLAKFRSCDDFSRSVSFATKMTAWASGANISAYVVPADGGCHVRMEGQAKVRSQWNADNAAHQQLSALLDQTSAWIKYQRDQQSSAQ